jgi:hypothetical protein
MRVVRQTCLAVACVTIFGAQTRLHAEDASASIEFRTPSSAERVEPSSLVAVENSTTSSRPQIQRLPATGTPAPGSPAPQGYAVQQTSYESPAVNQPASPQLTDIQPSPLAAPAAPRAFPRIGSSSQVIMQPMADPQVTNQTRQALGFYGGYSARATLSQLPRRARIQHSAPQSMRRPAKPFDVIQRDPTVSPYLNLYRNETDNEGAPNYFSLVRPQMDQIDANRYQQREMAQLRGQIGTMSSSVVGPGYHSGSVPGTGSSARYMDTAQFYGNSPR